MTIRQTELLYLAFVPLLAACGAGPIAENIDSAGESGESAQATMTAAAIAGVDAANSGVAGDGATRPAAFEENTDARGRLVAVRDEMLRAGKCTDDCLRELRSLYEAFPTSTDVRVALNNALVQRMDWQGLATLYEARTDRSTQEDAYLATVYIKLGRYGDAAALLVPLSDAVPADDELAYNAAYALQHMGDHEAAAARIDAGWEGFRSARHTHAMTLRALAHSSMGDPASAVPILDDVIAIEPDYLPAHFALGQAHAALGDSAAADAAFARVAELHAQTEADTAGRLRLSAQAEALKIAWAAKDYAEAEKLVDAMLPEVNEPGLRRTILEFAAAIYEATDRPDEARDALLEAGSIDVGQEDQP